MTSTTTNKPVEDQPIGPATILYGERRGKYPDGNSILVEGSEGSLIIDPSLAMLPRHHRLPKVDRVLNSHCHEDHIAGNHLFPDIPWHFHELDHSGIQSLDNLMEIYGFPDEIDKNFRKTVVEQFLFMSNEEAVIYRDGDVFDLGNKTVQVIHTPGHTRGHCCFLIQGSTLEDSMLYLGDIDLTSFGPYYGDAWSDLEDFEQSIEKVRNIEVSWYATFHHIGVLNREDFLNRLDRYKAVIGRRESQLLDYIAKPRTIDEIVKHRFIYRPQDQVAFADSVERRSMLMHLIRLETQGQVRQVETEKWLRD